MTWVPAMMFASVIAAGILATTAAWTGEGAIKQDGTVTWQAGVDGVEIEWNADGSIKRIYSRFGTPVEFADRRGISKAHIVAEEKAKAAIVRFMNQSVSSARVLTEVEIDLNKARQERLTGSPTTVQKVDERTLIQTLTEVTTSFAKGTLRGVIVLEKGYDSKSEEAWVVVGISEKTIRAAKDAREMQSAPKKDAGRAPPTDGTQDAIEKQPSEVRRSKQKEW